MPRPISRASDDQLISLYLGTWERVMAGANEKRDLLEDLEFELTRRGYDPADIRDEASW